MGLITTQKWLTPRFAGCKIRSGTTTAAQSRAKRGVTRKNPFDFSQKWDYLGNKWKQQAYTNVARSEMKMKTILAFLYSAWLKNLITWQERRSLKRALLTESHLYFKLVTCLFICVFSDVSLLFIFIYIDLFSCLALNCKQTFLC